MTKKHFIALADAIRWHNRREEDSRLPGYTARVFNASQLGVLAAFCREQNPQFNHSRWLSYIRGECGPNGGAVKKAKAA